MALRVWVLEPVKPQNNSVEKKRIQDWVQVRFLTPLDRFFYLHKATVHGGWVTDQLTPQVY